eukprot:Tamp_21136.p2 GENE.Tamp_21136~~Tamp_21136.p2  ORF type:complete len:116 (+),score=28.77 Tamp_21136:808-1155(+)
MWYLQVNTAEEFADEMRKRLPTRMATFNASLRLKERGNSLGEWFRESLGVGAWMERQEVQRRERAAKLLQEQLEKSGAMTSSEIANATQQADAEAVAAAGPVARARGLVRRTTGL